jgi:hypothetical protein
VHSLDRASCSCYSNGLGQSSLGLSCGATAHNVDLLLAVLTLAKRTGWGNEVVELRSRSAAVKWTSRCWTMERLGRRRA